MMYKSLFLLKCLILVKSNIIPELQNYPLLAYPNNYAQPDPLIPSSHFSPYPHQILVQNQEASSFPNYLSEKLKRILLERVLSSSMLTPVVNGNVRKQNDDDIIPIPIISDYSETQPNVVNNFIIIPTEYIEDDSCQCHAKKEPQKRTRNAEVKYKSEKTSDLKKDSVKKKSKKDNKVEFKYGTTNKYNKDRSETRKRNDGIKIKSGSVKSDKQKKTYTDKKKAEQKTADVEVSFDICEDCTNLESRKTRNNNYESKKNNQQNRNNPQLPKGFSDNILSYMNNIMSNQQYNPNIFQSNGNFPYNFDFMYQTPQQTNTKSNVSGNRQRNRKKKQRTNNRKQSSNDNNQNEKEIKKESKTSENIKKEIKVNVKEVTIQPVTEVTSKAETERTEKVDNKNIDEDKKEEIKNNTLSQPPLIEIIETSTIKPVQEEIDNFNQQTNPHENNILEYNDNDILDEYYPDFTSDNFYLSKEDFDYYNPNDRYHYNSDKEINRDKRKYERPHKRLNEDIDSLKMLRTNKIDKQNRKLLRKSDTSTTETFKTPPALENPDFVTRKVNKDRFASKEIYYQPEALRYSNDYGDGNEDIKRKDLQENFNTGVETVYAHSKVVAYSPPTREDMRQILDSTEIHKYRERNLISKNGDTTVVIAKSLGYPDY